MRFNEFTHYWNKSTVRDSFILSSGTTPSRINGDYFNGNICWLTSGELKKKKTSTTLEKITEKARKTFNLKLFPKGTFVIATYGLEATGVRGTCTILDTSSTISQACMAFEPKGKILNEFLYYWYLKYGEIIGTKYAQGTKQQNLSFDLVEGLTIYFPSSDEQLKICKFLDLLDQRIDTQSKIIEDLQTLKISICDKVFEDTTYPEYKLKDVLSERIEKSNVNNQYEILSSTIKGLFTQKEYFDKDIASSNNIGYKIVHLYDIIISPQNLWMGNITFNQRFTNGLVSPSYKIYIINNNFDMYYIANMLKTKRAMYKYICSSQQGASVVRRNLNMDDFLSLSFNIPDIIKQRKIGLLLNTIDKRIDLEQTYLTKLNQQKKFLLKNMFI